MSLIKIAIVLSLTLTSFSLDIHNKLMKLVLEHEPKVAFRLWHDATNKEYDLNTPTGVERYRIFKNNLKLIQELNSLHPHLTFGLTSYADLTFDEFKSKYLSDSTLKMKHNEEIYERYKNDQDFNSITQKLDLTALRPDDYDYSHLYAGVSVAKIGECLPSSIVAPILNLEGLLVLIRNVPYTKLSAQEPIDCDDEVKGCKGYSIDRVFDYATKYQLCKEEDYPSVGEERMCRRYKCKGKELEIKPYIRLGTRRGCLGSCDDQKISEYLKYSPYTADFELPKDHHLYTGGIMNHTCRHGFSNLSTVVVHRNKSEKYMKALTNFDKTFGEQGYLRYQITDSPWDWVKSCGLEGYVVQSININFSLNK